MAGLHERDELHRPLGLAAPPSRRAAPYGRLALLAGAALVVGLGVFLVETDDHLGGEPYAVASVDMHPPAPPAPPAVAPNAPAVAPAGPFAPSSASQVEMSSGVKVVRGGGMAAPGSLIIQVPDTIGLHLTPAPDKRLVDKSRYGLLPRIGADGTRPSEAYARPPLIAGKLKAGAPRIALLVGGLGLSESGTQDAIVKLPGAVSLGFAPYGADVEQDAAQAREAGHEAFLQAPMEPFDYPANNPGPHTLLSTLSQGENLDNLHWLMARFTGYVGVTNFLGAKFTADRGALSPVLSEIAMRGLLYLDDGSSPRSLARDIAPGLNLRAAAADVVIDADQSPQAIEAALIKLEALARANGAAIGVATALPVSVDHIGRWAAGLEARGLALVPLSSIAARAPGPAAQANP
ncbi:divergent polysaccharide deacetylase family protein [Methylocapsa sp. S129]|uniref:divergent polysaccharide deacetylase family protein n=1 Tax=Methylocapsa sp. S129 TaxID=1641869 RepID=UPI00131CADF3|nr:divergent polysaccharide deacetylase family protein [Methylocapsa sp. S129]